MTFPADIVGLIVTAVIGFFGALFVFKQGKDVAKKEAALETAEKHNEAIRVANEVKEEVTAELGVASDDHLVTVARRWLRPSATSDSKPN